MYSQLAFYILSFITVVSALFMVFNRNAVYSVLALIVTFFSLAGHYFMLNAQFLAAVHVIVYAGAIMVLFLYVIFMLNLNNEAEPKQPLSAGAAALASGLIMTIVLVAALGTAQLPVSDSPVFQDDEIGLVQTLGQVLYRDYMVPFEISAVLFLGAMVGAVLIGKRETD
jgi:NADH-quinone oxidoreductase subunit J